MTFIFDDLVHVCLLNSKSKVLLVYCIIIAYCLCAGWLSWLTTTIITTLRFNQRIYCSVIYLFYLTEHLPMRLIVISWMMKVVQCSKFKTNTQTNKPNIP